jgi:hypothetical protein
MASNLLGEPMTRARSDGTQLWYPPGSLAFDSDEDRVRCHLCGRWFRALAPGHLLHKHGIDADSYRELAGLNPRHPLSVPSLRALRARRLRARMRSDERIRAGMERGMALARSGALQRRAREVARHRGQSIERDADLRRAGRELGESRATAFRQTRENAAQALGFPDLESYLRRRYVDDGARIADLQTELGASYSAIRADLARFAIKVPRGRAPRRAGSDPAA